MVELLCLLFKNKLGEEKPTPSWIVLGGGDFFDFYLKYILSRESKKNSCVSETHNAPSLVTADSLESFLGVQKNL